MEELRRPGRNAPCPCGSRRTYARCCLGRDDAFEAVRAERAAFVEWMERSLFMEDVARAVADAWLRFWPGPPPVSWERAATALGGRETGSEPWDVAGFAQWVTHDAPLEGLAPDLPLRRAPDQPADGPATLPDVIAGMLDPQAAGAERSALQLLSAWRSSVSGLFRATSVLEGYRVDLDALCGTGSFVVLDASLARRVASGAAVVAVRLRPVDGRYEAVGVCHGYPAAETEALRVFATRELAALRGSRPQAGWSDLWRWRGECLHHYAVRRRVVTGGAVADGQERGRAVAPSAESDGSR